MKAAIADTYGPPEVLQIVELEKPTPKSNEVLIKVVATAVNSSDIRIRAMDAGNGAWGAFLGVVMRGVVGFGGPRRKVTGSVVSGYIEEVGEDVSSFKVGDEVFGLTGLSFGGAAEYCVLPVKRAIALKPKKASFEEAATLPFGGSAALYFLRKAGVDKAERVLIYGSTGAVGSTAVQIAKYYGAEVDVVCGTDGVSLSKKLGASKVYDYKKTDLSELTGKYDIIFDAVGKIKKSKVKHLLNDRAKYVTVASLDVAKELSSDLELLAKMYDKGKLVAVLDKTYTLEDIVEAHRYVDSGSKKGNVVIKVSKSKTKGL